LNRDVLVSKFAFKFNILCRYITADNKSIASTRSLFYVNDVFDVKAKVTHMKAARKVIANSALVKDKVGQFC
jgi:hypothetical protein